MVIGYDLTAGMQITVGHRTLADQNSLMFNESLTVVAFFLKSNIVFTERKANKSLPGINLNVPTNQI